jgi:fructuronate reductase
VACLTTEVVNAAPRLRLETLAACPPDAQPAIDPRTLRVRMVHLGLGAFHRAHQAAMTEEAVAADGGDWGICGVAPRRRDAVERLAPQDGLFALLERGPERDRVRVVATVREAIAARDAPGQVIARLADPDVSVVTLTVTEAGYPRHRATGGLRDDDPGVAADLAGADAPRTVLGLLVRGLQARMAGDAGPISVASCDNLAANGGVLERLVGDFCARLPGGERLGAWVAANVAFPSTVVDRIVPATTDADRADAARVLGLVDEATVVGEPYRSWVLEDAFAAARPAWERAGALIVDDVAPYEALKLRVLNATHSLLAYAGSLAGLRTVDEASAADWLAGAARRLVADVRPTLPPTPGVDVDAYVDGLFERWANPRIAHRLAQIAADGSQKLAVRLVPAARERRAAGATPHWISLALATWAETVARSAAGDRTTALSDPRAQELCEAAARAGSERELATAMLDALGAPEELSEPIAEWLRAIRTDGVERAVLDALRDG